MLLCGNTAAISPTNSSNWRIGYSTTNAQILWQKTETRPRRTEFWGSASSGITASNGYVVYRWEYWNQNNEFPCGEGVSKLIAFDESTGQEKWSFSPLNVTTRIFPVNGGFIMIDNFAIRKIDLAGKESWLIRDNVFPLREIETIYATTDDIYLVLHLGIHQVSLATGVVKNTLDVENVVGFFGDRIILKPKDSLYLQIMLTSDGKLIGSPIPLRTSSAWSAAQRVGDTLLLSYEHSSIEAFRITDGTHQTSIAATLVGAPVVLDDRLYVYSPAAGIQIYDVETFQQIGQIYLERNTDGRIDTETPENVWLTGEGNTLFINYRDTWELVTLQFDF